MEYFRFIFYLGGSIKFYPIRMKHSLVWFLSLVISLSYASALLATSLHQWARRYLRLAQPVRCSPEKRARMRAFFCQRGTIHVPWAVEGADDTTSLTVPLFLADWSFFLFNVDPEVSAMWFGVSNFSQLYMD